MKTKLIVGFLLLVMLVFGWGWFSYQAAISEPLLDSPKTIKIAQGDTINHVIAKLQAQNIAIQPHWFKLLAYRQNATNKLKAGEYDLKAGLTAPQLLQLFMRGKTVQYSITFPEGWTFKQMLQKIAQQPNIAHTLTGLDNAAIMAKLNSDKTHPEGLFFPATYFFGKNETDLTLLKKAYNKMQRVLAQEWRLREANLPLNTPYEALILASIVEKETAVAAERPLIAGVFTQRLRIGMMLQTDPTVIYGMGDSYQGNLRRKDLHAPTAYNTYTMKGLPPTPIAMPGREAIAAVLHPSKTNHLYFVARGDGTHEFSPTLQQHNAAVNEFQRK